MSGEGWRPLQEELDRLDASARAGFTRTEKTSVVQHAALRFAWIPTWILGAWVVLQVLGRLLGSEALRLAWWPWLLIALGSYVACLAVHYGQRQVAAITRRRALSAWDHQLSLQDRLTAADDFLQQEERSAFMEAAVEDAADKVAQTRQAHLEYGARPTHWSDLALPALALLVLSFAGWQVGAWLPELVVTQQQKVELPPQLGDKVDAKGERPNVAPEGVEVERVPEKEDAAVEEPSTTETQAYSTTTEEKSKESEGKTGDGRSAAAESTTGAGSSQGTPSQQGQVSKPGKEKTKAERKPPKKKESKPSEQPPKNDESESGSTAGRGSSKGSNRNPASSDWSSKDHVNTPDDDELTEEDEADDEEEEQEARGGMQPNMRDRRPPVSRELQISFGNEPSDDANGRGGPSQPKKSRGTASLVLGVPIPDRVKGQPNPGKTKITQERVQPKVENAVAVNAEGRPARATPGASLQRQELTPWMRGLVRDYFLAIRKQVQKP
ncbi:MAG: hypothetical protein ACPG31_11375 [Planctomycetota bacterium]